MLNSILEIGQVGMGKRSKKHTSLSLVREIKGKNFGEFSSAQENVRSVMSALEKFVTELGDEYLNEEPWFVFRSWLDFRFDPDSPHIHIFRAWQMFHWEFDPSLVNLSLGNTDVHTLAQAYLQVHRGQLDPATIALIEEAQNQPLDFYEVSEVNSDYVMLFGLISKQKALVYEKDIQEKLKTGEFLMAHLLPVVDSTHVFIGMSEVVPAEAKGHMKEFCKFLDRAMGKCPRHFRTFDSDVFNLYYDLNEHFNTSKS